MGCKGSIYNELNDGEYYVWSKLNPDIKPSEWALLCRIMGNMSKLEFKVIRWLIRVYFWIRRGNREVVRQKGK